MQQEHDFHVMRHCVAYYLGKIAAWKRDTDELQARLSEIEARAELLSGVSYDKVGSSPNADPDAILQALIRSHELGEKLAEAVNALQDEYLEAWGLCNVGGDLCRNRKAVWMVMVEKRRWLYVSERLHASIRTVQRWYRLGIEEIYYSMPEIYRRESLPNAEVRDYTRY